MIELRYGINSRRPRTLEEVGRAFGVTRERVRQIENLTLRRLVSPPEAPALWNCTWTVVLRGEEHRSRTVD